MVSGLDSIAATELTGMLTKRFATELALSFMFDHPTINSAASYLRTTSPGAQLRTDPLQITESAERMTDSYVSNRKSVP